MEEGLRENSRSFTFSLVNEDHTLANAVRFTLNQNPMVELCAYSIPHPSDNIVNIAIQSTDKSAKAVFNDGLQDLRSMCQIVRDSFDKSVNDFRAELQESSESKN
ncbi:DNA-directed RNA polymerase [Zostera marina]|uniref:DNA-directed RNA polymerase n=1 Tax=Zostera marina TaxID=29655 RepID=A0A0K9P3A7_ZOSMR|nr:DNA-directed RNA polymerase [Zostera marina]